MKTTTHLSKLSPKFGDAFHMKILAYQTVHLTKKFSNQNVITVKSYAKISRVKWSELDMINKSCIEKMSVFHRLTS